MATYAKVLLSGATYGSHEDIAIDATYTTIHQTSTTSGAIEDVTVVVYNPTSAAIGITISIEQDGTVVKSFTDSVPANDSKTVINQLTLGENIDVKIKQSADGSATISDSNLIIGNSDDIYTADLDGSNLSTFKSNIGHNSAFSVDAANGYLFKGSGSYNINVYSLQSGELLQSWDSSDIGTTSYIVNSRITAIPTEKKLHVNYVGSATTVIDYSDISAPTSTTVTNGGANIFHSGANKYGVFGFADGNNNLYFFPWNSLTAFSASTLLSGGWNIVGSYGGVVRGDPNGSGWAVFQGQGSSGAAHGTWANSTPASTTSVPEYYGAECVFDGNGNIIYIPTLVNSTYRIRKYALTSSTYSAQAGSYSDDYTKTIKQYRGSLIPINDGSNDVFIFHNKNNTASKIVLSDCSVSTLANDPYSGTEGADLGTFTGAPSQVPMYFTGYANQQLP